MVDSSLARELGSTLKRLGRYEGECIVERTKAESPRLVSRHRNGEEEPVEVTEKATEKLPIITHQDITEGKHAREVIHRAYSTLLFALKTITNLNSYPNGILFQPQLFWCEDQEQKTE